jgi:hypothetical protein
MATTPNPAVDPWHAEAGKLGARFHSGRTYYLLTSSKGRTRLNPKSEIRNPKQIRNDEIGKFQNQEQARVYVISAWDFGFVSDFGFRVSDFGSVLVSWKDAP